MTLINKPYSRARAEASELREHGSAMIEFK